MSILINYSKKMKNLKDEIIDIITGVKDSSKKYGLEIPMAKTLETYHLQENIEKEYDRLAKKKFKLPYDKYGEFISYFLRDLDLGKKLLGIFGKFDLPEYVEKYGEKSKKFAIDMSKKYGGRVSKLIETISNEARELRNQEKIKQKTAIRRGKEFKWLSSIQGEAEAILRGVVKDSKAYEEYLTSYYEGLLNKVIEKIKEKMWKTERIQSVEETYVGVCKYIRDDAINSIRASFVKIIPRNIKSTDSKARRLKECGDYMFKKYNPRLIQLKATCDKFIAKYSQYGGLS